MAEILLKKEANMCLTRVIGKKVLKQDLPCWGVVEFTEEGEKTPYREILLVANSDGLIKAESDTYINADCHSISPSDKKYKAGFHRFLNVEDAEKRKGTGQAIRKYTIPAGTEITIGVEKEGYVIVTPVLSLAKNNNKKEELGNGIHQFVYERENTEKVI